MSFEFDPSIHSPMELKTTWNTNRHLVLAKNAVLSRVSDKSPLTAGERQLVADIKNLIEEYFNV